MKLYHSIRKDDGPKAARNLVCKILDQNKGNVSKTARILGCSRLCVRRAREGPREDRSRCPKSQPYRTITDLEDLVLLERKRTRYGKRRLAHHLWTKHGIYIPEGTVRHVLRRHGVPFQKARRGSRTSKPLYDYEALLPFEEGQVDTKWIDDYGALGNVVFNLKTYNLPRYQWTYIDAKTKARFVAYSYSLAREYGWVFMGIIVLWLRANGIQTSVRFQADNGSEFCDGCERREKELNTLLHPLNASFRSIPAGCKWKQGIVERSHRTDDEEFYRPHLERIRSSNGFLYKAQRWQDTWNCLRQNWGHGMEGKTPLEKLRSCDILYPEKLLHFPAFILDDVLRVVKGGNDLLAHYQLPDPPYGNPLPGPPPSKGEGMPPPLPPSREGCSL